MKAEEVAEAFLKYEKASTNNIYSTGNKLFSYSTCIAQHSEGRIIGNATKYSSTTSKHLSYVKRNVTKWTTKNVPVETSDLLNYL